jgi:glycosyltransferase involved in cell wall biosynthesis
MKILIVLPVYNEEKIIAANLKKLADYLAENLRGYDYKIVVADNKSSDLTGQIVKNLLPAINNLEYFYLPQKGKGLAVLTAWQKYQDDFNFFAYMDADLATDLSGFLPLISSLEQGYDVAIGSRYAAGAKVERSLLRIIFSLAYSLLAQLILGVKIKDWPCGFKAITQKVNKEIVPAIKNLTFFFDSELLYLAAKKGFKIIEIPVVWQEKRVKGGSKINVLKVSWLYLKEIIKLRFFR